MLDYAAFPEQRQALIRQILQENGRVICAKLAAQMNVSEHTIRRDLQELSKEGICKKVYGGAVLQLPDAGSFVSRKGQEFAGKSIIAQKCVEFVKQGSCVFIDSGTTNLAIARALSEDLRVTVVTNSPEIAVELLKRPQCEVIMLGGRVNRTPGGCVGSTAVGQLQGMIFDQAFIGACAMDPDAGLTGFDFEDCEFKKAVVRQSNQVIIALTADKIPGLARYVVADASEIDVMVVEENLNKEFLNAFDAQSIHIVTV
ncbi:DeoR/GlpR transcriptional regulator [Prodigiosinella confusarubida]|uniref:DeoR/GlpR transcriptional regulator n=1 Tax=Serratia sp. (strain ATCC 39006) TaxID=104623 RepID=A0A2I5T5D3_SERS3|nr:DeoR/GlpR family DNA-binding transcription regulator [Serratia sp. ATCC 39006]AUG99780.1 DeoR/GlpR transcriptional regulator [Serratia sp. ATCC 39006]AUH04099.1 DeoR/GlpR transcriptional regulator [Serratia sp. ATCC 39006]